MNLTGGWHWRAWRSQERWAPASAQIEAWLMAHKSMAGLTMEAPPEGQI